MAIATLVVCSCGHSAPASPGQCLTAPTLTPATVSVGSSQTTGSAQVTASDECAWTATTNDPWLTIASGASGSGNSTVVYNIAANTSSSERTGALLIAGQTLSIRQAANAQAPKVTGITPNFGGAAGGKIVDISGTNFQAGAAVSLGGAAATVTSVLSTNIRIMTPAHAPGSVDVVVANLDGGTAFVAGGFTYQFSGTVTLDFDSVSVAPGSCISGAAYLASFGITFVSERGGATPLICNVTGTSVTAPSPPNVFVAAPATPNTDQAYRLVFSNPLTSLRWVRAAIDPSTSLPFWNLAPYDPGRILIEQGPVPTVGECRPNPASASFAVFGSYTVIASVFVQSAVTSACGTTYDHPHFDNFVLTTP